MKKVAVIQDMSSFGKCSLTAAIPVLSVMGTQACPLPTAILTAQTAYDSFYCKDLTEDMPHFTHEWTKQQAQFDGIQTGFVTGKPQIDQIFQFLEAFHTRETTLLVDPVMGDDGALYKMYAPPLLSRMKELVMHANIITPNITESCLLTNRSYDALLRYRERTSFMQALQDIGVTLQQQTNAKVIITGITCAQTGSIGNLYIDDKTTYFSQSPYNGKSYSGTGDLFSSVIMGGVMRGDDVRASMQLAEQFLAAAIHDTYLQQTPEIAGVHFEKFLHRLL
ncbi:MAG: pyridoxamine kinase [Solibacillus sp.]